MLTLAITGGIACGKSLVALNLLSNDGVVIWDADEVAHEYIQKSGCLYSTVVNEFGNVILGSDGEVNRSILGEIVFSDSSRLIRLNAIIHPEIKKDLALWIEKTRKKPEVRMAVAVVPLLYETGMTEELDYVICVTSVRSLQLKRLIARGLTKKAALLRIESQLSIYDKMMWSDYVIVNNGSEEMLQKQTEMIVKDIMEK